ncbi:hypothetical protein [Nocardia sp. BMG51109]|uniref:hypothetical protein n=1 Tax=Nocardia sp. BMG51109 TaxID=1056816 RepID=UPI0012EB6BCA|nr:hypothetical protein [Nocardia sp. BMG51109]
MPHTDTAAGPRADTAATPRIDSASTHSTKTPEPDRSPEDSGPGRRTPQPTPARRGIGQRRAAATEDAPANVDIHVVMRLLLSSHNLENVAKKAEAGDISLAEFIDAAHRTRTAAVDLVSAWFGGADHMRRFAEALLAAAPAGESP